MRGLGLLYAVSGCDGQIVRRIDSRLYRRSRKQHAPLAPAADVQRVLGFGYGMKALVLIG